MISEIMSKGNNKVRVRDQVKIIVKKKDQVTNQVAEKEDEEKK